MARWHWVKKLFPKVIAPLAAIAAATAIMPRAAATNGDAFLNFEGLKTGEEIANYYNGGFGSLGSGPGPDFGITFGPNSRTIISLEGGGPANIINIPSPYTVAFPSNLQQGMVLNVGKGLMGSFSFFYSSQSNAGTVNVYEGLGATGNILGSVFLPALQPSPPPNSSFQVWKQVNVPFNGVAKSIKFSGPPSQVFFDNIMLQPIPEPLTILGAATAVGFGAFFKRHLSKKQPPDEE